MEHKTEEELEAGLAHILSSPKTNGVVELIVRRPDVDQQEVLENTTFDEVEGFVDDNWIVRGGHETADGSAKRRQCSGKTK